MTTFLRIILLCIVMNVITIHAQTNRISTVAPSVYPNSTYPTSSPSPTADPNTTNPTWSPDPTLSPSPTTYPNGSYPTDYPTEYPNGTYPTDYPTSNPSPTIYPNGSYPTRNPTWFPTWYPTRYPNNGSYPTPSPSLYPNGTNPTRHPTSSPSPTWAPSNGTTIRPTSFPTIHIRYITFTIYWSSPRVSDEITYFNEIDRALRYIASLANIPNNEIIPRATNMTRIYGASNARTGLWQVRLGFQQMNTDLTNIYIESFLQQLFKAPSVPQDLNTPINNDNSPISGLAVDSTQEITQKTDVTNTKICPNGNTINAGEECTSVSSSISIVTIVVPIVVGVLVISIIIAFILIRRHRRAASVKAMTYATESTMGENSTPYVKETYDTDSPAHLV